MVGEADAGLPVRALSDRADSKGSEALTKFEDQSCLLEYQRAEAY